MLNFHVDLQINDKFIVKSGTDFRQFSKITIDFHGSPVVNIEEVNVTKATPEDPDVKTLLEKYEGEFLIGSGFHSGSTLIIH